MPRVLRVSGDCYPPMAIRPAGTRATAVWRRRDIPPGNGGDGRAVVRLDALRPRDAGEFASARPGNGRRLHREPARSEEHTSELQLQSNLVCRLLLEKKKLTSSSRSES